MNDSQKTHADVKVTLEPYLLAKVEKLADVKKISIEEALLYFVKVASHQM